MNFKHLLQMTYTFFTFNKMKNILFLFFTDSYWDINTLNIKNNISIPTWYINVSFPSI